MMPVVVFGAEVMRCAEADVRRVADLFARVGLERGERMGHETTRRDFLKRASAAAVTAGASGIFAPAILRAQRQPIKIGHLIPQSGFLSPMGEYMIKAASLAVEE
jgi:hypothetical protein